MKYAKCCGECIMNHECLFQDNNDVESCSDFQSLDNDELEDE